MRFLVIAAALLLSAPTASAPPAQAALAPSSGFGWPLAGHPRVDRPFQPPRTAYGPGHRGVDLRGWPGATVRSAGPGQVSYAGLLAGRGVVVVEHPGGLRTTYEPVTVAVRVGQRVVRGSPLGTLTTGHASCRTGTVCLHWGLLRGQRYLDPLTLLAPVAVRLLPVIVSVMAPVAEVPSRIPLRHASRPALAAGTTLALAGVLLLGGRARARQDAGDRGS